MKRASAADGPIDAAEAERIFIADALPQKIVVAVSGGPDSVALTGLLARWCGQDDTKSRLHVVTIDHGLRPESVHEVLAVADQAERLGLPCSVLRWEGKRPATGIQNAARMARYKLLASEAQRVGAGGIATAHTLDDQAETVLMRFLRGSGPGGLAGMSPRVQRGELLHWRPLLGVSKARLIATCEAMGLPFITDPSNTDPAYARARIRTLMASLAPEGLSTDRLAKLAQRQARANHALEEAAANMLGPELSTASGLIFKRHRLQGAAPEMQLRALAIAFSRTRTALRCNDAASPPAFAESFLTDDAPVPLEKLEMAMLRIDSAIRNGKGFKLTLAGLAVCLSKDGSLSLVRQPPRRPVHSDGALSLGKVGDEA